MSMVTRAARRRGSWLCEVAPRVGDELFTAAGGAEEDSLSLVLGLVLGGRRINRHAANGILRERGSAVDGAHRQIVLVFHEWRA